MATALEQKPVAGKRRVGGPQESSMADDIDHHADGTVREKPQQGIFIGWLALGLAIFALAWIAVGLIAGATHGWQ